MQDMKAFETISRLVFLTFGTFHFLFNWSVLQYNYITGRYEWKMNMNSIGEAHIESLIYLVVLIFFIPGLIYFIQDFIEKYSKGEWIMTGFSIPRNMEDVKRLAPYYKKLISMVLIVGGGSLMLEHLFEYGGFDLLDFAGHEYYGLAMIVAGFLLSMKWEQWKKLNLKDIRNWIR